MNVSRARSTIRYPYRLKGHILETQDVTKYLGVDLQSTLSWKPCIDRISKKANSMLGFLRRNLRSCSEDTKAKGYYSMVRSNLEYCSSVWSPHHKEQIQELEMIQRRAAPHTTNRFRNTSSVSSMLEHLQWESLVSRRSTIQLILFYKVANDLIDIPTAEYLSPSTTRTRSAHSMKYRQFFLLLLILLSLAFSLGLYLCGTLYQPLLLMPLLWYLSRRGYPPSYSK